MECPQCNFPNPAEANSCAECNTPLHIEGVTTSEGVTKDLSFLESRKGVEGIRVSVSAMRPGTVIGGRYEVLQLLGEGGMGAVYKAKDRELDRLVALKVIRPELAENPEIHQRFKQELILARQVTHKNVIRIFDLGEAEGTKFISMEYIEGQDLRTLLRERGKFTPEEAVGVMAQVCRALDAAHSEGVVHRDLKPANIMVDKKGKVSVMDFGVARSIEQPGITQTGTLVGTLEYMSPEQAQGEKVDTRSDLFTLGIIFYELLTGKVPFQADTPTATLLKRLQEQAVPPAKLDAAVPLPLSDVTVKCLQIDTDHRYQSALEVLWDLEAWTGVRRAIPVAPAPPRPYWKWIAAGVSALLLGLAGFVLQEQILTGPSTVQESVTLLVSDIDNATGDPVFNGALEPMFDVVLEDASFISAYNRGTARRIAGQLQPGTTRLDEDLGRLVAVREGINVVVAGSIAYHGTGYRISVRAVDAMSGNLLVTLESDAANRDGVLGAVRKLAAGIRSALGDTTPESVQLAAAETFTTTSLEAAHNYAIAQDLQLEGKWEEAIESYLQTIQLDPNLGRAYAGLAVAYYNSGQRQAAEKYYQQALARIDRMSDREKYRTRGGYYLMTRNAEKAVEEFSALVEQYPVDTAGIANLALAYFFRRDMAQALQQGRRAVEMRPKNVIQRNNVGLYAMYAGDFDSAIREQQAVLEINPSFVLAHVGMALPQLATNRLEEATATYNRVKELGPHGASAASAGLADLALYEGRTSDAVALLEQGIAGDLANNNSGSAANKLTTLAHAHLLSGNSGAARAAADRAVSISKAMNVQFWTARVYLALHNQSKALARAKALGARLGADPQAYAKLIEGEIQLERGNANEAVKLFHQAQQLADTWLGRLDLGRAYLEAGAFTEAHSEFELCLKRRGEATAAFLDEVPTYRLLPPVYYYLGRAQEGLGSPAAAESYRTFLGFKEKGDAGNPLVADARRRLDPLR